MAQPALQRQKTFVEEPANPPCKKPRLEPAEKDAAPPTGDGAPKRDAAPPSVGGDPPKEDHADAAEQDASQSHGSLSQETLVLGGAGSPFEDDDA